MSKISELHDTWEHLAQSDPLWAILSDPGKKGRQWQLDEFFRTGEREIAYVLDQMAANGAVPKYEGNALDFGCGVGRLTQALGAKFSTATGVDISETMIQLAIRYNRQPDRCSFVVNTRPDLSLFDETTFDFLYTSIVLQHIPPEISRNYLRDFVRILRPGALLAFQVADDYTPPQKNLKDRLNDLRAKAAIGTRVRKLLRRFANGVEQETAPRGTTYEMYLLPSSVIRNIFRDQPGRFLMEVYSNATDVDFNGMPAFFADRPAGDWVSKFYVWQKDA